MSTSKTDFLRFSAYSIKDLITRKLSEDSHFTDQIYEGSNLAIMIDIFSYIAQCLLYQLNNAASESMFADTQLYENITRLVKFIGYQVRGCSASSLQAYVTSTDGSSLRSYSIPPYARIDTGLTDRWGKKIYFSTSRGTAIDNFSLVLNSNSSQSIQLFNGEWKLYSKILTASGIDNETFVLDELRSNDEKHEYVAHDFIDIYVYHEYKDNPDENKNGWRFGEDPWVMDKNGIFTGYESTDSALFNNQTVFRSLYPGNEQIYTVFLNEDKQYVLKFGNGVVGKKLCPGDKIYVFYLDTNGPDGKIDTSNVNWADVKLEHSPSMFGITDELYDSLFNIDEDNDSKDMYLTNPEYKNKYSMSFQYGLTTQPSIEQSVEDIRQDAPLWFTTGNRLVTRFDYEYYLKNARNSSELINCDIIDVKCMNNWEYLASFYKWLYELGTNGKLVQYSEYLQNGIVGKSTRYLTKNNFTRKDYFFADSADANNLYIWIKSATDGFDVESVTRSLNNVLNPIKLMTAELVACKAINVKFDICAAPIEHVLKNYLNEDFDNDSIFDENCDSYIEVTLDDNTLYVPSSLQKDIYNIIIDGFNINHQRLGQNVKFDQILNRIYEINGVYKVRTIFKGSALEKPRIYDGLSFAAWSDTAGLIKLGDDLTVTNTIRQLEDFQFPVFRGATKLMERIKIIKKTLSSVNTIKF